MTLDDIKYFTVNVITNYAESVRNKIAKNPTALKASAWGSKEARARRIIDGIATDADTALVRSEADQRGRGETVLQLAKKQIDRATALLTAVSVIDGMESRAIAAVNAAVDVVAVDAVMTAMQQEAEAALAVLGG
ncbi:hypothetical protein [Thiothrix sp.]|uniref:hypothetical protein n=1 Tax=Thiothrix sp. TaxID=1032 RepID=UPI0025796235|nr:hypothetical protein [Thiothrix sp.]